MTAFIFYLFGVLTGLIIGLAFGEKWTKKPPTFLGTTKKSQLIP